MLKTGASRPARIVPTMPSIMPLGATISAPARAWLTACRASNSSVASLSTSVRPARLVYDAAMAMVGVFAETNVGDNQQIGKPHP